MFFVIREERAWYKCRPVFFSFRGTEVFFGISSSSSSSFFFSSTPRVEGKVRHPSRRKRMKKGCFKSGMDSLANYTRMQLVYPVGGSVGQGR